MGTVRTTAQRQIGADPDQVYAALADYVDVRPTLLPAHLADYEVRAGGHGAGTQVHWTLRATEKRVRDCLVDVSEPGPRTLVERDANSSMRTTWTVDPADPAGGGSVVRVETTWQGAGGIGGFFERRFAPLGLRRIYQQMLDALVAVPG